MALTTQSKLLLDWGWQLLSIKRIVSKCLGPTFIIKLKEFPDDYKENVLHQDSSLMSINVSQAVTTKAKLPMAPLGLGQFRKVSSVLLINISRKHSQTFLTFYSQYRSVIIASKLSTFLNKAPVKELYSLTVQQQSSAGRRIRLIIIISSLPNQMQSTLQLTRKETWIFKHQTPPAEGLLSLTLCHESVPAPAVLAP